MILVPDRFGPGGPGRRLAALVGFGVALLLAVLTVGSAGVAHAADPPPKLNAKAWVVIDARTGEALDESAADRRLPMASTTKMMTAYLALRNLPMKERVKATDYKATPAESLMGLEAGQVVSVRDLLYGLILLSGNDAAVTLAEAVSGSEKKFVGLMNRTAVRLGLDDTHYENPVGLDAKGHFTTASDLARLGQVLMAMPRFRPIAAARTATLHSYSPPVEIETHDGFLLNNSWARGIKTGHTQTAGYVLASDGRKRATELIGAVIGTPTEAERDSETVRLLEYGFSLYRKRIPVRPGRAVASVPIRYGDGDLDLVSKRAVRIGTQRGEELKVTPTVPEEVEGPVRKGQLIGTAEVSVDGDPIATVKLLAADSVAEPGLLDKVFDGAAGKLLGLLVVLFGILGVVAFARHRRQSSMRRRLRRVTRSRR